MFVFEEVTADALALVDVATKDQLPFDEYLVVAGRVHNSRQLMCLGGRVKHDGKRRLLVLPLSIPQQTSVSNVTTQTPSVQVLDVGEMAVRFLQDVRACFPTLVRKNPMEDADDDDSDSEEEAEHKKQKRGHDTDSTVESEAAKLQFQAVEYMSQTRVKVLESLEQLFSAFQIADPTNVQAALGSDPSFAMTRQILCMDLPALSAREAVARTTTAHTFNAPPAPPEPLNFGVMFTELSNNKKEQYLHVPVPRSPPLPMASAVNEEDAAQESFQDATVLSFGTKREATAHGGGKNCEEMIKNIRMRHASGTFCTLVLPEKSWEQVADEHKSCFPQVSELQGELRLRRLMGSGPCVPVELHLED
ncbi:Phospholipase D [Phytophthora boehmeriae]|uniref:Phospholipase D n=1 Tax=Phytophthora boehmeriae TaxID=109152 RepID=A0A8T1X2L7_9STRA|nr:Phospholipase D [Phytophthora boehmeriae]